MLKMYRFETVLFLMVFAGAFASAQTPTAAPVPNQPPCTTSAWANNPNTSQPALPACPPPSVYNPVVVTGVPTDSGSGGGSGGQNPLGQIMNALGGGGPNAGRGESVGSNGGMTGDSNYSGDATPGTGSSPVTAQSQAYGSRKKGKAPIEPLFKEHWARCSKQVAGVDGECSYQPWGIWPSSAHCAKSPNSCHNSGSAIDVGLPIKCGGSQLSSSQVMALAQCISQGTGTDKRLGACFQSFGGCNANDHKGHIHVQIRNCQKSGC